MVNAAGTAPAVAERRRFKTVHAPASEGRSERTDAAKGELTVATLNRKRGFPAPEAVEAHGAVVGLEEIFELHADGEVFIDLFRCNQADARSEVDAELFSRPSRRFFRPHLIVFDSDAGVDDAVHLDVGSLGGKGCAKRKREKRSGGRFDRGFHFMSRNRSKIFERRYGDAELEEILLRRNCFKANICVWGFACAD